MHAIGDEEENVFRFLGERTLVIGISARDGRDTAQMVPCTAERTERTLNGVQRVLLAGDGILKGVEGQKEPRYG